MSNYLTIKKKIGELDTTIKFNVKRSLADTILKGLREHFKIELLQGSVTSKKGRVLIELRLSDPNAQLIKQAFMSQLSIFQNLN